MKPLPPWRMPQPLYRLPFPPASPWYLLLHRFCSIAAPDPSPPPIPARSEPSGIRLLPLNGLRDNKGATHQKKRLGRGIGSGKGKTAGRGHKGQKARSGRKPGIGFEGGQTPLRLRLPRRGFNNVFGMSFKPVNLKSISESVEKGIIDASQLVTMKTLKDAGLVGKKIKDGVKLLGAGASSFSLPINIEVSRVSNKAKEAVEAAGGSVRRVHYNKLGLRALLDPDWFTKKGRLLPRPARPPPKIMAQVDDVGRLPAPTVPVTVQSTA